MGRQPAGGIADRLDAFGMLGAFPVMLSFAPRSRRWRWLAPLLAVVVLGLGLLAVAPAAHEELHADAHEAAHSCAIVLFAEGVLTAAAATVPLLALCRLAAAHWRSIQRLMPPPPVLHPPLRGPPGA